MAEKTYVGIDMGTSRTSISTSTGVRETVWSFVGYAEDHVARKALGGRDVVYGQEAVKNRMSVNLVRPLEHGVIKTSGEEGRLAKKAVRHLVEYVMSKAQIPTGNTIYAVIGAPADATVESKAAIIEAAKGFADNVIVCSEPFAVAYGLDFLKDTLVIDIGAGTTDLCRVHGTMPKAEDQRTHKVAGDHIDALLGQLIKKKYPEAQFSINMLREIKERNASVTKNMDPVMVNLTVKGRPKEFDITDQVRQACESIVEPTVNALQDLIATYDPEFQEMMRNNVLLGGGGSQITGLGRAIEEALREFGGGTVRTVEEPQYAGANGALKIALDMPENLWTGFEVAEAGK